jgi:hypothetical protein
LVLAMYGVLSSEHGRNSVDTLSVYAAPAVGEKS